MINLEKKWIAKNIDEIIKYYSDSPLSSPKGIDLKGSLYEIVKKAHQRQIIELSDSTGQADAQFLRDATHYFNKSIYSLLCYKYLQMGGYFSWSEITKYYIRFYINISLTRIQGHSIMHGPKGRFELLRSDWKKHIYTVRKAKTPGGFHTYIWDVTKEYYKSIKPNKQITTTEKDLRAMFDDKFYRELPGLEDVPIRREDLEHRDEFTYNATGFDELYYADVAWSPVNRAFKESKFNFMDEEVFQKITNVEDYDGTGLEEAMMGGYMKFTIELLGQISDCLKGKYNPIHFKYSLFKKIKSNDDTLKLLLNWANENKIQIT
jgi:hypothetical protein